MDFFVPKPSTESKKGPDQIDIPDREGALLLMTGGS